ncbi:MerR family transcriptional regulator [Marinobacter fonticola]|uniref:MerR family transcriptional regulator n=1 Tax=Marinobacter fonticola TaxID=2603215 RepID=UPI0011E8A110|nr:MerR family transcriptional regulator [Marinobacter fonticola]
MKVKEIARLADVSADTVRFYRREGLLRPRTNPCNGYHVYDSKDLSRLRFIRAANKLGLNLNEVRVILDQTMEDGGVASGNLKELFADRLLRLEQELNELKQLRDDMKAAVEEWQHRPGGVPNGENVQKLIGQWS